MVRRKFLKLAAVAAAGAMTARTGLTATTASGAPDSLIQARIGVFFPPLDLLHRVQQQPESSFVWMVTGKSNLQSGNRKAFAAALRLPNPSRAEGALMTTADLAEARKALQSGMARELGLCARIEAVESGASFFHPYASGAQCRVVCCSFMVA